MRLISFYLANMTYDDFCQDQKTIDAVTRNFEIIGEATNKLPTEVKNNYPDIPWSAMYRLRNIISHEYFGIDHQIIWRIAKEHLPKNLKQIEFVPLKEK